MSTIDDQIRALFEKLNTRKAKVAELEAKIAKGWITNCSYRLPGSPSPINLNTASAETILEIVSDLVVQRDAHEEAALLLEIAAPSKQQGGYAFDAWVQDCKKRLAAINIREEKKALDELEARLNTVLSPEERRRIEVEQLLKSI